MKYMVILIVGMVSLFATEVDTTQLAMNMPSVERVEQPTKMGGDITFERSNDPATPKALDSGVGTMEHQDVWIDFSDEFRGSIGDNVPIVTMTPIGRTAKLHIKEITSTGFRAGSAPGDPGEFQFTWIAVGRAQE